ncbi:MAG: DUF4234 domain-containing protein [Planctomycetes bacterium]|nr:DUF4234 domain-containing protein [Planctomycetota bacterium]
MNGLQDHLNYPIHPDEGRSNVAWDIVLTLITCGIYNLFWQARKFRVLNAFLGRADFSFWHWFFLSIITCGVYHIYTEYVMGQSIVEIQRKLGQHPNESLSTLCLVLTILGLALVTDAIQQGEINRFFESPTP